VRLQTADELIAPVPVPAGRGYGGIAPPVIAPEPAARNLIKINLIMTINQHKLIQINLIAVDLISMALSFLIAASFVVSEVDGVPFIQFFSIRISILNFTNAYALSSEKVMVVEARQA
jgi:hypothetical protein